MMTVIAMLFAVSQIATAVDWPGVPVAQVRHSAKRGVKAASLELGMRYERGTNGVPCDAHQALRWYRAAAHDDGGQRLAYSPPVGRERYGRLMPIGHDSVSPGLPMAGERLAALEARLGRVGGKRRAPRCLSAETERP